MTKFRGWHKGCATSLLCAATAIASLAQTFTTFVNFNGTNGAYPIAAPFSKAPTGTSTAQRTQAEISPATRLSAAVWFSESRQRVS